MTRYYNTSHRTHRIISVSQQFNRFFLFSLLSLMAVFVSSCEKGILKIGGDLLPEGDFVSLKSIDTLSAFSYTMYDYRIRTDNPSVGYLGSLYDPAFGTTTASFVSQLRLTSRWDGKPFTVDSVRLYLRLLTATGKSNVVHTLRLSEIADIIYPDSTYYSNSPVALTNYVVKDIQLPALQADTINNVVLKLPVEFGNYLLRDTLQLFYAENAIHYSPDHPDFRSYFRGLYFQMDPGPDPVLVSMYLAPGVVNTSHASSENALAIYIHDNNGTKKEYDLNLDADSRNAAFNVYVNDYSTADADKRINHINDGYKDSLSYQQCLNGVYTKITIPGLEKVKSDIMSGKIAINKARLIVPVKFKKTSDTQYYSKLLPMVLGLRYKTEAGDKSVVPDYNMAGSADAYHYFFDGSLDSVNMVYKFNIPAFVQSYLDDATNTLEPSVEIYQGAGTNNVILRSNKNKPTVKFEFTYTKF
jgi:hypothetical protein